MCYFDSDGDYETWLGVPTLPKLNWSSAKTRERMAKVVQTWLPEYDGWRIDVANMTGRRGAEDHTRDAAAMLRRRGWRGPTPCPSPSTFSTRPRTLTSTGGTA